MQRYVASHAALTTAMALMIEEDDGLLIALIDHPLRILETRLRAGEGAVTSNTGSAPTEAPARSRP